jgi:hypothetical protein
MDSIVFQWADTATRYGLLGILITLAPALLLVLGFKTKGRVTWFFAAGVFLSFAVFILGLTVQGLFTGEVFALSRSSLMVLRSEDRAFF